VICQHIANDFNEKIVNIVPDSRLLINFVHCFVYEIINPPKEMFKIMSVENFIEGKYDKYNNNAGWNSDSGTETSLVAQCFSHFSWQITKGHMMIVDLQGVDGILTDPQIHCLDRKKFGDGNLGYYGMLRFFVSHTCNKYCKSLGLIHPKENVIVDDKFSFFVEKFDAPKDKYEEIYKLCDLCRLSFSIPAGVLYEKRIKCFEAYCEDCDFYRKDSMVHNNACIDCNANFAYSAYWFQMKRTDCPVRCGSCRLQNRNRLRMENTQNSDTNIDAFFSKF